MDQFDSPQPYTSAHLVMHDGEMKQTSGRMGMATTASSADGRHRSLLPKKRAVVAAFDGSFAAQVRPRTVEVTPWYLNRDYYLGSWLDLQIWKAAFVELVATAGIVFVGGQMSATLGSYGTNQVGAYVGIANTIILSVFIYATAPASGGHMNPVITFASVLTGLCPLARGVLYMIAQTIGGALAGGVLAGIWGHERSIVYQGGGCWYDPSQISAGQLYLNESFSSFVLLYLAYGVGLDPRQALLFGPKTGPFLVGLSIGIMSFVTSGFVPGIQGAQMNPARCFGFAVVRRDFAYQWIWWFGPALGAILLATMYNLVPPEFGKTPDSKQTEESRVESQA